MIFVVTKSRTVTKLALVTALLCGLAAAPASAATTIRSGAFDLTINLSLLNIVGVGVGPFAEAAGLAPAAYNQSEQIASANETLNLGVLGLISVQQRLSTGVLEASASSTLPPTQFGTARSEVNNLSLDLGTVFLGDFTSVLSIGSSEVVSRSSVAGSGGAAATGFASLAGLVISGSALGGATIDGSAFVNPDPNTVLFQLGVGPLASLRIVLNEQTAIGAQTGTSAGISTNAIRLIFNSFSIGGGLLSGDVIIAHSEAQINDAVGAVPEPATWAQMILGFGLIGLVARRRKVATA